MKKFFIYCLIFFVGCINAAKKIDRSSPVPAQTNCLEKDRGFCVNNTQEGIYRANFKDSEEKASDYICDDQNGILYCPGGCYIEKLGDKGRCNFFKQGPDKIISDRKKPEDTRVPEIIRTENWQIPEKYGVYLPVPAISQRIGEDWTPKFQGDNACGSAAATMVVSYFGRLEPENTQTLEKESSPTNPLPRSFPDLAKDKANFTYFLANAYTFKNTKNETVYFNELKGIEFQRGSGAWGSVSNGYSQFDEYANLFFKKHDLYVYGNRSHKHEDMPLTTHSDTTVDSYRYWLRKGCVPVLRTFTWRLPHYVIVKGVTPEGKVVVNDPWPKADKSFGFFYDNVTAKESNNALVPDVIRSVICDESPPGRNALISAPLNVTFSKKESRVEIKFNVPESAPQQPQIWGAYCFPENNITCWGTKQDREEGRFSDWGNGDGEVRFEVLNTAPGAERKIFIVSPYAANSPVVITIDPEIP